MADVIVEKDRDSRSNTGLITGIIVVVLLVLVALFVLPGLMNNGSTSTTPAPTPTTTTTPAQ
jgi:hypothetical protein